MTVHPQSSPRGLFQKEKAILDKIQFGHNNTTELQFYHTSKTLKFSQGTTKLPGNVDAGLSIGLLQDSTGCVVVVNSTGTTWTYLATTTKRADAT